MPNAFHIVYLEIRNSATFFLLNTYRKINNTYVSTPVQKMILLLSTISWCSRNASIRVFEYSAQLSWAVRLQSL